MRRVNSEDSSKPPHDDHGERDGQDGQHTSDDSTNNRRFPLRETDVEHFIVNSANVPAEVTDAGPVVGFFAGVQDSMRVSFVPVVLLGGTSVVSRLFDLDALLGNGCSSVSKVDSMACGQLASVMERFFEHINATH